MGRLENVSVRSTWPALDDGKTIPEIYAMADAVFANLDTNGDGQISEDELREQLSAYKYRDELLNKIFASIDVDASGDISVEELRSAFVNYPTLRTAPGLGGLLKK
uniref:EF-hand domain-containing protein n=1 Tax=Haptolina ericina TaxID=156174 RepID=A0A7S3BWP5_9EUKA